MTLLLLLAGLPLAAVAQDNRHHHQEDSTDMFFRHLQLNELTVTGVAGDTKLKHSAAPVTIVSQSQLRAASSTNVIDAIARQPGVSQLTTGGAISKPIIRGLGYNRVVVMADGVRQEGQQWGDEHGIEVDGSSVGSVEILKGPASLMYGSDAMAGVIILHPHATPPDGERRVTAGTEYQTNNGLFGYSLSAAGSQRGFVWNAGFSGRMAHAYKNKCDGYVPGSQFREHSSRLMVGIQKPRGHSRLTWTAYHLTPSIVEGPASADGSPSQPEHSPFRPKSYAASLPFQRVSHYKLVWDNLLNLPGGYLKAVVGYQQNDRQEYGESADYYELFLRQHTLTYDLRYVTGDIVGWRLSAGVGGMYQQSDNKGDEYLIPDYRLFDCGFYATATKTVASRLTVSGGLRYDHRRLHGYGLHEDGTWRFTDFTRRFNGLTGSLGAVWNVSDHLNLRLNVARGFRTPNMSELASNGVHEGSQRYEIGSQRLRAEYSLQADFGLDFTSRYVSAQIALFVNHIANYIFTHRLPEEIEEGCRTYGYTQGDARLLGFEAGVDFHPVHSVHFSNTFSFVDARQTSNVSQQPSDFKYLPFTPAPHWTSELKWELLHHRHSTVAHRHNTAAHCHPDGSGHRSPLNNLYVAVGADCWLSQRNVRRADGTETPTPSYTLVSLSAGTDIQAGSRKVAELYVVACNLFDRAYQNHLSRLKYVGENGTAGRQGFCNMGRNITFKLTVPLVF